MRAWKRVGRDEGRRNLVMTQMLQAVVPQALFQFRSPGFVDDNMRYHLLAIHRVWAASHHCFPDSGMCKQCFLYFAWRYVFPTANNDITYPPGEIDIALCILIA